jgi:UDP-arabinose 4-epimerase
MSTVLVTGGAGYVGSQCCKHLADSGYKPVVLDDLSTGHQGAVLWGPLEVGNVAHKARVLEVIDRHKPAAVIHFAAKSLVGESVAKPELYYRANITSVLTLLEAMRERGIADLVFSSTCAIYAPSEAKLLTEDAPLGAVSPYGLSKYVCERIIEDFGRAHRLNAVRLRYFNAAGADPDGAIGEDHAPETHLIPVALDAALGRRPAIEIFGTDYPTADGSAVRDYIHVADLAVAHVNALKYLAGGGASLAANLGTGRGHSVLEVLNCVEEVTGKRLERKLTGRRAGDPATLVADPRIANAALRWTPARSDLKSIVADAWRWHQKRFAAENAAGYSA